jgi:peptide-methionine (R)-S-oxide reductase
MKNPLQENSPSPGEAGMANPGRRAFIVLAAGAVSGAAFWALRRAASLIQPQLVSAADAPANVTIVEFAADGKKTGKVTVARIVKSDAEWKRQLSPISY